MEIFTFSRDGLLRQAESLRDDYRAARPFPHVIVDDFLPKDAATRLLDEESETHRTDGDYGAGGTTTDGWSGTAAREGRARARVGAGMHAR